MNVYRRKALRLNSSIDEEFEEIVKASPLRQFQNGVLDQSNPGMYRQAFSSVPARHLPTTDMTSNPQRQPNLMTNSVSAKFSSLVSPTPYLVKSNTYAIGSFFKTMKSNLNNSNSFNASVDSTEVLVDRSNTSQNISIHSGYMLPPSEQIVVSAHHSIFADQHQLIGCTTAPGNTALSTTVSEQLEMIHEGSAEEPVGDIEGLDSDDDTLLQEESTESLNVDCSSLYMWIIKPVPNMKHICVEGKKSLTENEFWHSGIVTEIVSPCIVVTATGSVYKLEGEMECQDAMLEGFSEETVEQFRNGFPQNWTEIISAHFEAVKSYHDKNTTTEDIAENSDDDDDDDDISILEVDPEVIVARSGTVSSDTKENKKASKSAKNKSTEKTSSNLQKVKKNQKDSKEQTLSKWIVKPHSSGKGVYVVGFKLDGDLWHTATIEQRLDYHTVKSSNGSMYKLKGHIDKLVAKDEGIPKQVISAFKTGFPKDWMEVAHEYFGPNSEYMKQQQKDDSKTEYTSPVRRTKKAKQARDNLDNLSRSMFIPVTKSEKVEVFQALSNPEKKNNMVLTPTGHVVNLQNLQRSKSGRLIKPPLNWWTGQCIVDDPSDGCQVAGTTPYGAKYLNEITEDYLNPSSKGSSYKRVKRSETSSVDLTKSNSTPNSARKSVSAVDNHKSKKKHSQDNVNPTSHKDSMLKSQMAATPNSKKSSAKDATSNSKKSSAKDATSNSKKSSAKDATSNSKKSSAKDATINISEKHENRGTSNKTQKNVSCSGNNTKRKLNVKTNRQRQEELTNLDLEIEKVLQDSCSKRLEKNQTTKRKTCYDEVENEDTRQNENEIQNLEDPYEITLEDENVLGGNDSSNDSSTDEDFQKTVKRRNSKQPHRKGDTKKNPKESASISKIEQNKKEPETAARVTRATQRESLIRQCKGPLATITEDTSMEVDENHNSTFTKTRSRSGSRQRNTAASSGSKGKCRQGSKEPAKSPEDGWTQDEQKKLCRAMKEISQLDPKFWSKVAQTVGTRTETECQEKFHDIDQKQDVSNKSVSKKTTAKKKSASKAKASVPALTAGKGTLKRKQQLREILINHNKDYQADMFDASPYRQARTSKIQKLDDEDECAIFEDLSKKQGKNRFETPVSTATHRQRITAALASEKKTPSTHLNFDILKEQDDERYIHRVVQRVAANRRKKIKKKPAQSSPGIPSKKHTESHLVNDLPLEQLFEDNPRGKNDDDDSDDEEEKDYYWSEEDTA